MVAHQLLGEDPTIKYGVEGSPWSILAKFFIEQRYLNTWGKKQPIYCAAIDLGWGKDEAHAKYFLQNFEPLFFQQIFGVFGMETTKKTINFIPKTATSDIDGFESWGVYSNIKRVSLRNLIERHLKNPKASNFHFSDRPCFTEQWFKQLVIRRMNEKGLMEKPHDHARDEAESCMIYSDASFLLAFKDFENGPDWEDFKEWNKRKLSIDTGDQKVNIVGNIF